jgi:transposase
VGRLDRLDRRSAFRFGPITASVLAATLPDVSAFRSARDLSAWLGVRSVSRTDRVPARTADATLKRRQGTAWLNLEDGKPVYPAAALPRGDGGNLHPQAHRPGDDWLGGLIRAKPLKVVAIALANRMARAVWAMLRTGEAWRAA